MYENWKILKSEYNAKFELSEKEQKTISDLLKEEKEQEAEKYLSELKEAFEKKKKSTQDEYAKVAEWCNENQTHRIIEKDKYYAVEKIPEPTLEEKSALKRAERDNLLVTVVDPVVTNPLRWEELSDAQKSKYRAYRLYLLDIPQQEEFPDIEIKSFEEFLK